MYGLKGIQDVSLQSFEIALWQPAIQTPIHIKNEIQTSCKCQADLQCSMCQLINTIA